MKSIKIAVMTAVTLSVLNPSAFALFDNKKLQETTDAYEQAMKDNQKLEDDYRQLEDKFKQLEASYKELEAKSANDSKENFVLKQDRENLMAQARNLLVENSKTKELQDQLAKLQPDTVSLKAEGETLRAENVRLREKLQQVAAENKILTNDLNKAKADAGTVKQEVEVKSLTQRLAEANAINSRLNVRLGKMSKELEATTIKNDKLSNDNANLTATIAKNRKDLADAAKKNDAFLKEMQNMPKKFAETARQNRQLIKETSEMHYNLGVFYMKVKEFERARMELEKAVDINPEDASTHFNLGYVYAEYMVDRKKAVAHFKEYIRLSKTTGKDVDWAKKYILTWETFEGKDPMQ